MLVKNVSTYSGLSKRDKYQFILKVLKCTKTLEIFKQLAGKRKDIYHKSELQNSGLKLIIILTFY